MSTVIVFILHAHTELQEKQQSRFGPGEAAAGLRDGDMHLLFDGGRHVNETGLQAAFKNTETGNMFSTDKHTLYLQCDEDSVAARKLKVRGPTSLPCMEFLHDVTNAPLRATDSERLHYGGTTRSNVIGNIRLPSFDELVQVSFAEKKSMLGPARFEVGGPTSGVTGKATRNDSDMEPISVHALPKQLYECLAKSYGVMCWLDLTAMDPTLATTAVLARCPYVGVMFTDAHQQWFVDMVAANVFSAMQDSNSPLYKPELVVIMRELQQLGLAKVAPENAKKRAAEEGTNPQKKLKAELKESATAAVPPASAPLSSGTARGRAKGKARPTPTASGKELLRQRLAQLAASAGTGEEEEDDDGEEEEDDIESEGGIETF